MACLQTLERSGGLHFEGGGNGSWPLFYDVRERFAEEGNAALNPRSRAPKRPARCTTRTPRRSLGVSKRLKAEGWDAGPISICHRCDDEALVAGPIPSVYTIARIMAEAGVVDANPRKRPRASFLRFQRAAAIQLWQPDALEYALFTYGGDGPLVKVTIYQLLDDSTRFDVGTEAFADPENGNDATATVTAAIAE